MQSSAGQLRKQSGCVRIVEPGSREAWVRRAERNPCTREHRGIGVLTSQDAIIGNFHAVSIKHLHRYLTEFEYRFNERKAGDRFEKTVAEMLKTKPMPMKQLTADSF